MTCFFCLPQTDLGWNKLIYCKTIDLGWDKLTWFGKKIDLRNKMTCKIHTYFSRVKVRMIVANELLQMHFAFFLQDKWWISIAFSLLLKFFKYPSVLAFGNCMTSVSTSSNLFETSTYIYVIHNGFTKLWYFFSQRISIKRIVLLPLFSGQLRLWQQNHL